MLCIKYSLRDKTRNGDYLVTFCKPPDKGNYDLNECGRGFQVNDKNW